jgi:transcriptional regulator with XRE-family HTH domain
VAKQQASVSDRSIGLELQRLRRERKISCQAVGDALGMSKSTISRLENGGRPARIEEVASILTVLGVVGVQREDTLDLARRQSKPELVESRTSTEQSRNYINFESKAVQITNFELALIPGLGQTAEYAHATLSALRVGDTDEDIEAWVALRMSRQAILTRKRPPGFHWILTEDTLRRPTGGPRVMARQVRHLLDLTESPHVTITVIPSKVAEHPGLLGQFVLLDFASDPSIVYVEDRTTGLFLDDEHKVHLYRLTVEKLTSIALDAQASARLMRSIVRDLERE